MSGFLLARPAAIAAGPEDVQVSETDMSFVPNELAVPRGTRVVFRNDDQASHQVLILHAGDETPLPKQRAGDLASFVFPDAGTYDIGCDFHPEMSMTIIVR